MGEAAAERSTPLTGITRATGCTATWAGLSRSQVGVMKLMCLVNLTPSAIRFALSRGAYPSGKRCLTSVAGPRGLAGPQARVVAADRMPTGLSVQ